MSAPDTRHALLVTSAWLAVVAEKYRIDEATDALIRHKGKVLGRFSLGYALNLADAALAPRCNKLTCNAVLTTEDELLSGRCEKCIQGLAREASNNFATTSPFPDAGSRA